MNDSTDSQHATAESARAALIEAVEDAATTASDVLRDDGHDPQRLAAAAVLLQNATEALFALEPPAPQEYSGVDLTVSKSIAVLAVIAALVCWLITVGAVVASSRAPQQNANDTPAAPAEK